MPSPAKKRQATAEGGQAEPEPVRRSVRGEPDEYIPARGKRHYDREIMTAINNADVVLGVAGYPNEYEQDPSRIWMNKVGGQMTPGSEIKIGGQVEWERVKRLCTATFGMHLTKTASGPQVSAAVRALTGLSMPNSKKGHHGAWDIKFAPLAMDALERYRTVSAMRKECNEVICGLSHAMLAMARMRNPLESMSHKGTVPKPIKKGDKKARAQAIASLREATERDSLPRIARLIGSHSLGNGNHPWRKEYAQAVTEYQKDITEMMQACGAAIKTKAGVVIASDKAEAHGSASIRKTINDAAAAMRPQSASSESDDNSSGSETASDNGIVPMSQSSSQGAPSSQEMETEVAARSAITIDSEGNIIDSQPAVSASVQELAQLLTALKMHNGEPDSAAKLAASEEQIKQLELQLNYEQRRRAEAELPSTSSSDRHRGEVSPLFVPGFAKFSRQRKDEIQAAATPRTIPNRTLDIQVAMEWQSLSTAEQSKFRGGEEDSQALAYVCQYKSAKQFPRPEPESHGKPAWASMGGQHCIADIGCGKGQCLHAKTGGCTNASAKNNLLCDGCGALDDSNDPKLLCCDHCTDEGMQELGRTGDFNKDGELIAAKCVSCEHCVSWNGEPGEPCCPECRDGNPCMGLPAKHPKPATYVGTGHGGVAAALAAEMAPNFSGDVGEWLRAGGQSRRYLLEQNAPRECGLHDCSETIMPGMPSFTAEGRTLCSSQCRDTFLARLAAHDRHSGGRGYDHASHGDDGAGDMGGGGGGEGEGRRSAGGQSYSSGQRHGSSTHYEDTTHGDGYDYGGGHVECTSEMIRAGHPEMHRSAPRRFKFSLKGRPKLKPCSRSSVSPNTHKRFSRLTQHMQNGLLPQSRVRRGSAEKRINFSDHDRVFGAKKKPPGLVKSLLQRAGVSLGRGVIQETRRIGQLMGRNGVPSEATIQQVEEHSSQHCMTDFDERNSQHSRPTWEPPCGGGQPSSSDSGSEPEQAPNRAEQLLQDALSGREEEAADRGHRANELSAPELRSLVTSNTGAMDGAPGPTDFAASMRARGPIEATKFLEGLEARVTPSKKLGTMDVHYLEYFEQPDADEALTADRDKTRTLKIGADGDIILEPDKQSACKMESREKMLELSVRFESHSENTEYMDADELSDYRFYMHVILAKYCKKYPWAAVKAYDAMVRKKWHFGTITSWSKRDTEILADTLLMWDQLGKNGGSGGGSNSGNKNNNNTKRTRDDQGGRADKQAKGSKGGGNAKGGGKAKGGNRSKDGADKQKIVNEKTAGGDRICFAFQKPGGCTKGDSCHFAHVCHICMRDKCGCDKSKTTAVT